MSLPYYLLIKGTVLLGGTQPDGDSVRFRADQPELYNELKNGHRIRPNQLGTVQLRLEGVDAPELHYGTARQPFAVEPRDALLTTLGFTSVLYAGSAGTQVSSCEPLSRPAAILSQASEIHGRPISFLITDESAIYRNNNNGTEVYLSRARLRETINYQLLAQGFYYSLAYSSLPATLRRTMLSAARTAREQCLGVWALDQSYEFRLVDADSVGATGALIFPKLFRRCTDYLRDVVAGRFSGNLPDWLLRHGATENDGVVVNGIELRLSDLLQQRNSRLHLQADPLDLIFIEK